jgi:hypothetical protein
MAQHAGAVRYVLGRLFQQILGGDGICADYFVGGDADSDILVVTLAAKGSDDNMLGQQARTTAFGQGNVDQRNDRAAKIENAEQIRGRQRNFCKQRPVEDFFYVENGQAESLAAAAEDAELRLGRSIVERTESFQQIGGICAGGQRCQMKIFVHAFDVPTRPVKIVFNLTLVFMRIVELRAIAPRA